MNRQIKFRVWDKKYNLYTFDYLIHQNGSIFSWQVGNTVTRSDEDVVFQRFTGKKDVNGIEIYEGDILEYSEGVELGDFVKCRGVVVYDEISCAFGIAPTADSDPINYFWEGTLKGFRVVGNIFEKEEQ
jgi:hypothetical protein